MELFHINKNTAESLVEKWSPVLDYSSDKVSAIVNENTRLNTAILLENQEKWCFEAANASGDITGGTSGSVFGNNVSNTANQFSGDRYATGDARLPKVLIPMIRRTFPELITNEIVGVQPMTGPVGLAFAMRYQYESSALGYPVNGGDGNNNSGPISGNTSISQGKEIGYNYLNTSFTGTSSSSLSGLGTGTGIWDTFQEDAGVAALLSQFELSSNIPQMTVSFQKTAVEAGTRRLAAKWSVELEQDLKNMNGIDIDAELTNAMSYEIQAEIDREMIMRMVQTCLNAGGPGGNGISGTGYSVWSALSADGRWSGERARDFYNRVVVEANRVAIRNRRGAANFIIATPRICAILETLPNFTWQPVTGNVNTTPVGIAKVGAVGGRFQIYRDTRTEAEVNTGYNNNALGGGYASARTAPIDYALLGYKGPEYYDTGIVYCPYIPVMVQRTIGPNDFSPRVGLLTRYGVVDHIFGANLYYHLIICTGLGQQFTPGSVAVYL
jgi:Major capsid protein Gp23